MRTYLLLVATTAANQVGRPADAAATLESLAGDDLLTLFQTSSAVYNRDTRSLPKLPDQLELGHLCAAALDEAYLSTGRADRARLRLEEWLGTLDRASKTYGERAKFHRVFALVRRTAIEATAGNDSIATQARSEALAAMDQFSETRLYSFAKMVATAAGNCSSNSLRSTFADAALAALKLLAPLGAYKSDDLKTDSNLRALFELPAFRPLLASFDETADAVDQRLASGRPIETDDQRALVRAAVRRAEVQISGRIASARSDPDRFTLRFTGAKTGFYASGFYDNGVPRLVARTNDLSRLVGGTIIMKIVPSRFDSQVSGTLQRDEQIVSFSPNPELSAAAVPAGIVAAEKVTLADLGKRLLVEGTVKNFGKSQNRSEAFVISFAQAQDDGFIAVLLPTLKPALEGRFPPGSNIVAGATIRVAGVVEVLDSKPQILITDVSQIEMVKPGP